MVPVLHAEDGNHYSLTGLSITKRYNVGYWYGGEHFELFDYASDVKPGDLLVIEQSDVRDRYDRRTYLWRIVEDEPAPLG